MTALHRDDEEHLTGSKSGWTYVLLAIVALEAVALVAFWWAANTWCFGSCAGYGQ